MPFWHWKCEEIMKGGLQQQPHCPCAILSLNNVGHQGTAFCMNLADGLFQLVNPRPQPARQKHATSGHVLVCIPCQACGVNNIAA